MAEGFDLEARLRGIRAANRDPRGEVLSGCVLERLLGRGGMGEAWAARRQADGAEVVVKLLDPAELGRPEHRMRARREAATLQKVRPSPHVVAVRAVDLDHARPHLVLELVPGEPLDRLLLRRGRLPWREAAAIGRDLTLGLVAVHEQGIVHRDVKPGNAILRPDGRATLIDFGLAKDLYRTSLTQAGSLVGTAMYMAPEQWDELGLRDGRCDLFSLGATLYHLVAGRPPFEGQVMAIAEAVSAGDYVPLDEAAPDVDRELALLVDALLAPEPAQRPPLARAVVEDLECILAGQPSGLPALVGSGGRWPLVRGRRWTLGGAPRCEVVLPPPVSPAHAQVRRAPEGRVLVDVRGSAGTRVNGAVLRGATHVLRHGDAIELAGLTLRYEDRHHPVGEAAIAAATPVDGPRRTALAPVVVALAEDGDPRTTAWLVELLVPDPAAERAVAHAVAAVAGEEAGRGAAAARVAEAARAADWARARLAAVTGAGGTPAAWLEWWLRVRGCAPEQVAPAAPPRALRLVVERGVPDGLALDGRGVVLVGHDPRCAVVLPTSAPRLAATLVRLHARWVARDERTGTVVALDPGGQATFTGARLALELDELAATSPAPIDAAGRGPVTPIDAAAFWGLAARGHPAALPGLVAVLDLEQGVRRDVAALGLEAHVATRALALAGERVALARERLASAVGRDLGPGPDAWLAALEARGGALLPAGWAPPAS